MKERLSLVNMILKLLWGEIAFPKRFDFQSASSSKDNGRKLTDHNHHHYYYYCCCRWWYLLLGLLVLGPSISSDSLFISKYKKCYYKVWRVLQSATENPSICKAVVTSSHDCHFPGSTHKRKLKIFWPISLFTATARGATVPPHPQPWETDHHTRDYVWEFFYKANILYLYSKDGWRFCLQNIQL